MKKLYGTLEISTKNEGEYSVAKDEYVKRKRHYWIVKGFQAVQMINRIIPESWSYSRNEASISDHIANIEHLEWLMMRYPLKIISNKQWDLRLKDLKKVRERKENIRQLEPVSPSAGFKGELKDFQKLCLDFLQKTSGNALVADEMGLGKGVETLAFLSIKKNALPALVICPLIVIPHWEREIKKFLNVKRKDSTEYVEPTIKKIRSGKQQDLDYHDFYLINYELISKRIEDLERTGFKTIVFDEIQNLRNMNTKKFASARELASIPSVKYRLGLSGTPIYNRGAEIWGMVDILQHGILGSYSEFTRTYCEVDFRGRQHVERSKSQALSELLKENVMIRRKKDEVLKELPEKTRYQERVTINRDLYTSEIEKIFSKLENEKDRINSDPTSKHKVFQLQSAYQRAMESERQVAGIAKAPRVIKRIQEFMELEEKIVVFCHHKVVHELLMQGLAEFNPCHIIGGQKDDLRQQEIDRFQKIDKSDEYIPYLEKSSNLMIAGIRAGSMGISLTSASYVIFAELDWTPAIHRQAEDRLHRIGQKKPVFAHYLIGEGTLDTVIADKLVDKSLEIDSVMGDKREINDQQKAETILKELEMKIMKIKNK